MNDPVNPPLTPGRQRSLQNLRRGGIETRPRCQVPQTRAGRPCKAPAVKGSRICWRHQEAGWAMG